MDSYRIPSRIVHGDFAGWLRDAMTARRLSARMVGLRTGIHYSTVTRILNGERSPTLATAVALLGLLEAGQAGAAVQERSPLKPGQLRPPLDVVRTVNNEPAA